VALTAAWKVAGGGASTGGASGTAMSSRGPPEVGASDLPLPEGVAAAVAKWLATWRASMAEEGPEACKCASAGDCARSFGGAAGVCGNASTECVW
jgi:hypothetical protein